MNDTPAAAVATGNAIAAQNPRVRAPRPPPMNRTPLNPKEDYTQTHILPLQSMRIVVRAIVRLGVVPIVVALLVLVLRPGGLGGAF